MWHSNLRACASTFMRQRYLCVCSRCPQVLVLQPMMQTQRGFMLRIAPRLFCRGCFESLIADQFVEGAATVARTCARWHGCTLYLVEGEARLSDGRTQTVSQPARTVFEQTSTPFEDHSASGSKKAPPRRCAVTERGAWGLYLQCQLDGRFGAYEAHYSEFMQGIMRAVQE